MNVICNHYKERFDHDNCYFFENLTHFLQPKAIFLLRGCDIWAAYCV